MCAIDDAEMSTVWSEKRRTARKPHRCQECDRTIAGYPPTMLREELTEHWHEGFRSVAFGRLIVGQRRRWHDGRDPVPDGAVVAELARQMMRSQVAA